MIIGPEEPAFGSIAAMIAAWTLGDGVGRGPHAGTAFVSGEHHAGSRSGAQDHRQGRRPQ
jgi:hypothetical protein